MIGRNQGCSLQLNDGEISGQHAAVRWSSVEKCWKVGGRQRQAGWWAGTVHLASDRTGARVVPFAL